MLPQPVSTAILSKYLRPGAVFLVANNFDFLFIFFINLDRWFVFVAFQLILESRFKAVLSQLRIAVASPFICILV